MLNINEVIETNKMIHEMNLDVRTITMGISLLDCVSDSLDEVCENIYNKITTKAKNLVKVGKEIEQEFDGRGYGDFKKAVGDLYKKRLIEITDEGLRLV